MRARQGLGAILCAIFGNWCRIRLGGIWPSAQMLCAGPKMGVFQEKEDLEQSEVAESFARLSHFLSVKYRAGPQRPGKRVNDLRGVTFEICPRFQSLLERLLIDGFG